MDDTPKTVIPDGYKDKAAFLQEARERFMQAQSFDSENREAARDDLKFLAGEQWDDKVRKARIDLGRPCLTINQLPQFVAQVVGDIRVNRPGIKVRPAEDGDKDVAEVRQGLIRAIEYRSGAQMVYSTAGTMQTACGIGNFRVNLDYAGDDTFDRDVVISAIPDPLAVVWDPLSTEVTGKDARFCFVADDMPRKEFEAKYGEQAVPSELGDELRRDGWLTLDTVRITEYWLVKEVEREIALVVGQDGRPMVVPIEQVPEGVEPQQTRKSVRRVACMYLITGHDILEGPVEFPIDRVPIFRAMGWEIPVEGKRQRFGLVRFAKDPARLKNYWRSVSAEMLALAPKSQWLANASAVENREDQFRNAHRSGDPLLIVNDGGGTVQRMDPPALPAAVLQEAANNAQDIKDVTGIHDASLGVQGNETSGRAIMARDRQGDVATYIYPDNLKEAIGECGRVINQLIPVVYDTARTVRILGEDETSKVVRINDPSVPDSVRIDQGKYDVIVETGPSYTTKRLEAADSMMQFVQAVPNAAAVTADLIAQSQDWPMADKFAERLRKTLPPELAGDDEEEMTPEQQMAKQQAQQAAERQQAMADEAMQLDLAEKRGRAAKATADAGLAMFQLGQLMGQGPAMEMAQDQLFGAGMASPDTSAMPADPALG